MWTLQETSQGWAVVRSGKNWARIIGSLLLFLYGAIVLIGVVSSPADALTFALFFAIPLLVPGILLWRLLGRTITRRPTAILEAREVPGGIVVTVMDDTNKRHELVTDTATATSLTAALAA